MSTGAIPEFNVAIPAPQTDEEIRALFSEIFKIARETLPFDKMMTVNLNGNMAINYFYAGEWRIGRDKGPIYWVWTEGSSDRAVHVVNFPGRGSATVSLEGNMLEGTRGFLRDLGASFHHGEWAPRYQNPA